jgi:DNA-binding MarR family transcriptional regulator
MEDNKRIAQLTAEVPKDCKVTQIISRRTYLTAWGHFRIGTEQLKILAQARLTARERAVLDMIMYYMKYDNIIKVPQSQIAKDLDIEQQDVSKAIKVLIDRNILKITGKEGRRNTYTLNPYFAYKGYAKNWKGLCDWWDGGKTPVSLKEYQIRREQAEARQDEIDEILESDPN